jgi:hypothetical protein
MRYPDRRDQMTRTTTWRVLELVALMLAASFLAVSVSAAASQGVVLGSRNAGGPNARGFGESRPRTVFLGGDPTGYVGGVSWRDWGATKSSGFGRGNFPPPGKSVSESVSVPVSLHASSLGRCRGRRAYRRLSFFFKFHGRWIPGATLSICGSLSYR